MTINNAPTSANTSFENDSYAAAYPELRAFWEAAAQEQLLVRVCDECERAHWYPRMLCPFCGSGATVWHAASGRGRLYAFSEVLRTEVPYVLAYVRLAEGPVMMTNIVHCDPGELRIDQPVRVVFQPAPEGRNVPMFTPDD